MKNFYLKNGKEVQTGDVITVVTKTTHPLGESITEEKVLVTETTLPLLVKAGIILTSDDVDKRLKPVKSPTDLNYYLENLAKKLNWKVEKLLNYLNVMDSVYPAAAFSLVLREVAIELDKKYKDHIKNSPEIYVISVCDGKIHKVNKSDIKNYKNFAAFRSVEDAKIACGIVRDILKYMFKNEE